MQTEKLSLWDRIFNRYCTVVIDEGTERWFRCDSYTGIRIPNSEYQRNYVKYKKIDRVTGSEEIFIKYLNN